MKRFLVLWLGALLVLVVAVAGFNLAVDPYGILGAPRIAGFNADKPAAADRPRLSKSYLVDRAQARTLLLGASNVDVGMNPDSPAIPASDRPAFNLAIDGSLVSTLDGYLRHALVLNQPRLVVVGLALEDAMIMPLRRLAASDAALYSYAQRLRTLPDGRPNPGYLQSRIEDTLFATLSTQALTDSVLTLLRQRQPDRNRQTASGQNTGGSFVRWTRDDGAYALVVNKDREKAGQFVRWAADPRTEVAPIGDMLRVAREHGARIVFFIQPTYVDEVQLIQQTGLMPAWEAWKTQVVQTLTDAAGPGPAPEIWDFSGYTPYNTEPLPAPGDTARALTWFWEPIHYRASLGDALLARMLDDGGPDDLGTRLTAATLPAHLAETRRRQTAWEAANPQSVQRVAAIVTTVRREYCAANPDSCPTQPRTASTR